MVFTVHWNLTGVDGEYTGSVYGAQALSGPEGSTFTPYADLTEEEVIGWVQSAMGEEEVAELEANVAGQIAGKKNPTVVTPGLPWVPAV